MADVTIIDATGCILGRMANQIAKKLVNGETVHIVNAEKAVITGTSKQSIRIDYMERHHLGTYRKGPFMSRMPHDIVKRTVRGMLPYQKPSGRAAYKRLKAHIGVPADLAGQPTIIIEGSRRSPRGGTTMTVGEVSASIGAPFKPESA